MLKETLKSATHPQVGLIVLAWSGDENILNHRNWTIGKVTSIKEAAGTLRVGGGQGWPSWRVISKSQSQVLLRAYRPSKRSDLLLEEAAQW